MPFLDNLQSWIILALGLLALVAEVYALIHAVRVRADAFPAAGKQTKVFWVSALAIAALIGLAFLGSGFGLLSIVGIIVAGIYLADVRPAVDQMLGRRR